MISVKQEKAIRKILDDPDKDMTDLEIANEVGVSRWPVRNLRRTRRIMIDLWRNRGNSDIVRVTELIKSGLPLGAVVVEMKMPRSHVKAIRRWFYLIKRRPGEDGPCNCPACGSIIWGDEKDIGIYDPVLPVRYESDSMKAIVADVIDLDELRVVRHPLFHYLAQRAKEVYREAQAE
ncbi:MAG: hypothetical protein ACYS7Y_33915 [Planctomycetota bacterium]